MPILSNILYYILGCFVGILISYLAVEDYNKSTAQKEDNNENK
jgi:positive regulator of sigma E activity